MSEAFSLSLEFHLKCTFTLSHCNKANLICSSTYHNVFLQNVMTADIFRTVSGISHWLSQSILIGRKCHFIKPFNSLEFHIKCTLLQIHCLWCLALPAELSLIANLEGSPFHWFSHLKCSAIYSRIWLMVIQNISTFQFNSLQHPLFITLQYMD